MKKTNLKKLWAFLTAALMTAGLMTSCGNGSDSYSNGGKNERKTYANDNDVMQKYDHEATGEYENYAETNDAVIKENNEEYAKNEKSQYKLVSDNPLSTFSTDVDTASYTNVRRMINAGESINSDAVRIEEFINYFKYDYPQPENNAAIQITTDLTDCPWNDEAKLMLVGMQAQETEIKDVPMNLVFLIDVSGSMMSEDKLPLVQQAFSMLAENLGKDDRISIVTYAGEEKVVLQGEIGSNQNKIISALNDLQAGGSTAGEAGINMAYELAEEYFIDGGNNRVILATDGDLNVGLSSADELTKLIEEKRESGVFLSVLGFGTGNLKDDRLEALADNGNGNYSYIDSLEEAERVLVTEMSGTLFMVAKDAKIQVEFNPENVYAYKLVGYENRALNDEDFNNDAKDAGDIGAGQQVTALYEIIPADGVQFDNSYKKTLKYQSDKENPQTENKLSSDNDVLSGELLTVSMRYKKPDEAESKLIEVPVAISSYSPNMKNYTCFASCVAQFAMHLRGDQGSENLDFKKLLDEMEKNGVSDGKYFDEFKNIIDIYNQNYK